MIVSIYVTHYNRLEFLSLQYENMKKHCKDEFNYIVINNGIDDNIRTEIAKYCRKYNIQEIDIRQEQKRSQLCSHDHIMALDYAYKQHISKDKSDVRVVLDNDVIPFKPFSFLDLLDNCDMAGFYQESMIKYSSAIFTAYSKSVNLINFEINGKFGDSGSGTGNLIRDNNYSAKWVDVTPPIKEPESKYIFSQTKVGAIPYNPAWMIQFIAGCFVHFYRGTGWDNGDLDYFKNKLNFFTHFIHNPDLYNPKLDEASHYPEAHMDEWLFKDRYRLYKIDQ